MPSIDDDICDIYEVIAQKNIAMFIYLMENIDTTPTTFFQHLIAFKFLCGLKYIFQNFEICQYKIKKPQGILNLFREIDDQIGFYNGDGDEYAFYPNYVADKDQLFCLAFFIKHYLKNNEIRHLMCSEYVSTIHKNTLKCNIERALLLLQSVQKIENAWLTNKKLKNKKIMKESNIIPQMISYSKKYGYASNESMYLFYDFLSIAKDIISKYGKFVCEPIIQPMASIAQKIDMDAIKTNWDGYPDTIQQFASMKKQMFEFVDFMQTKE